MIRVCTVVHFSDPRILGQSPFRVDGHQVLIVRDHRDSLKLKASIRLVLSLARWLFPWGSESVLGGIVQDERLGLSSLSGGAHTLAVIAA